MKFSFNNTHQFYVPSNVTISKDRPFINRIADNPHSLACLSISASVWIIILAVNATIFGWD